MSAQHKRRAGGNEAYGTAGQRAVARQRARLAAQRARTRRREVLVAGCQRSASMRRRRRLHFFLPSAPVQRYAPVATSFHLFLASSSLFLLSNVAGASRQQEKQG